MATSTVIDNGTRTRYGAPEIKTFIRKNTIVGFIVAAALILLLLLLYFVVSILTREDTTFKAPIGNRKFNISDLPPPPTANEPPPVPPPSAPIQAASGPAARAGTPVAVPDALITEDMKDFAKMDEVSRASAIGGEGEDFGGFSDAIGDGQVNYDVNITEREEEPTSDEFIAVEKEAEIDLKDIQSRVEYPTIARRAGVEGKVTLRVLIGKDGKPKKAIILDSSHEWFNKPAQDAVMSPKTVAVPAIQNKQPVEFWVTIPIVFTMK